MCLLHHHFSVFSAEFPDVLLVLKQKVRYLLLRAVYKHTRVLSPCSSGNLGLPQVARFFPLGR